MTSVSLLTASALAYFGCSLGLLLVTARPLNMLVLHGKSHTQDTSPLALVRFVHSLTVPKSWFSHFYVLLCAGMLVCEAVDYNYNGEGSVSSYKSIRLVHLLVSIQAVRRAYESFWVTRFSSGSKINVLHYAMGMGHYLLLSVVTGLSLASQTRFPFAQWVREVSLRDYTMVAVFLYASADQYQNHLHLASLKKYSLPAFSDVASPHYTNEVVLYSVLFVVSMGAPRRIAANYLAIMVFVATNLSISSVQTLRYYREKYKEECRFKWAIFRGIL